VIDRHRAVQPVSDVVGHQLWDVVVVGAGPAGSTIAGRLAQEGFSVLLIDRQPFPREKVCGDALIPDALNALRRAGLYETVRERGYETDTLSIFSASTVRIDLSGEFMTLRRRELDELLVQGAMDRGAAFHCAAVDRLVNISGGVQAWLADSPEPVTARIGVVATGADVKLIRGLGIPAERRPSGVALRCYARSPVRIPHLIISYDRSIAPGYAWIFPLGNDVYNIGCGMFRHRTHTHHVSLRTTFETFVSQFPLARDLWNARWESTALVGARLRCGLDPGAAYDGRRTIAIGETIGATFPFTGEGIGKAMETGELAAEHVSDSLMNDNHESLASFPGRLRSGLAPKYAGYRIAERWLGHSWLGDVLARRIRRSPALRHTTAGIVNETTDPRNVFSWKTLLPGALPWRLRQ
jgi:geranylgeranyl reductase family protein